jgi:hypothetical protein
MSSGSDLDPVELDFRALRGALYAGDGHAAIAAIERRPDLGTLQYMGDGLRLALFQGIPGATGLAEAHIRALRDRDVEGDEDLATELEAMLGLAPVPALRGLPVDLDLLSLAIEGDPLLTGGRIDLQTGEVVQIGPLYESDLDDEFGDDDVEDENDAENATLDDDDDDDPAPDDDADDPTRRRWLRFDSQGSRAGFQDMVDFLETITDERHATHLERALHGRGAFRRFKDELADVPGELARFFRFTEDRRLGRARQWLREFGLRTTRIGDRVDTDRPHLGEAP